MDRNKRQVYEDGYQLLKTELRATYTNEQLLRLHGNPRDQDNESMHSAAAKKFSKATRPPCLEVFTGQIASTAGMKNWGRGYYLYRVVDLFGSVVHDHKCIINKLQLQCIYTWHRSRADTVKIQRAVSKKKYKETQARRTKGRTTYAKHVTPTNTGKRQFQQHQPQNLTVNKETEDKLCTKTNVYVLLLQ